MNEEVKIAAKELAHALKIFLETAKTDDDGFINVACDYAADKAKEFLAVQEGRNG